MKRVGAGGAAFGPRRRRARFVAALLAVFPSAASAQAESRPELVGDPISDGLILFGSVFLVAAAVGVLRFPDFYIRLHAATKLVTLGGVGIFGGAAIGFADVAASERVLLVAAFFFLTAPLSGYMIARSGDLRGLTPFREASSVDEWGALGAMVEKEAPDDTGQLPNARDTSAGSR